MKKIFGKFILGFSKILNKIFEKIISGLSFVVDLLSRFSIYLILLGIGIFFLGFFAIPILFILLTSYVFWIIIFVFFVLPFLGKKFISFLKYLNYTMCEYLNDYGNYLIGNINSFRNFNEHSKMYYKKQQEQRQREREQRQREEREQWERRFNSFNEFFTSNQSGFYQNYNSQGFYNDYTNSYSNYQDPYIDFKNKFEKCCRTLELEDYDVDFYKVKLQYRILAKKYHPDLNHDKDATEKFQEINSAFEFLTQENIKRYKEIIKK